MARLTGSGGPQSGSAWASDIPILTSCNAARGAGVAGRPRVARPGRPQLSIRSSTTSAKLSKNFVDSFLAVP